MLSQTSMPRDGDGDCAAEWSMSSAPDLFDRIVALSRFDGDSRLALIALHEYFSVDFPDSSLALLRVRGQGPGRGRLTGLIGPDGTEHVPNLDPNAHRSELPLFDDALTARLLTTPPAHVASIAPAERGLPLAQALFAPASTLAVPLANAGELSHWLVFGSTLAHRFDQVDLERILLHVNLATSLIVRPIVLRELTQETERQRNEIESLADIQKLLLPDNPLIRGLDYAVHWQPAATAAGDYYEMSNLTEADIPGIAATADADIWGVIVGDVSGHGVAAAAEAMQFDAILRTFQGDGKPAPASAISYANRYFFSRRNRGHFMTVFALLYQPDTRALNFLSAGHPPMLHRRGSDVALLGESDQIPLGVLRDFEYGNNVYNAQKGDIYVLYTDGIVEARDAHGREFGMDRLRGLVAAADAGACVDKLRDVLVAALHAHQGGSIGSDDQTLLVLRIAH
jgi:sigma-B regulation protein RsbU (phosphoserine phosphatase)